MHLEGKVISMTVNPQEAPNATKLVLMNPGSAPETVIFPEKLDSGLMGKTIAYSSDPVPNGVQHKIEVDFRVELGRSGPHGAFVYNAFVAEPSYRD